MLTDEQIEAVHKALDELEREKGEMLNLSDPDHMRELCARAGLPKSITDKAIKDLWDA